MSFVEREFMEPQRRMKALQFDELGLRGGEVVFLGDSITAGGAWHEWFPDVPVVNRGIDGDTTDGVLNRLDSVISEPSKVFLLIGTNDLSFGRPIEQVFANQRSIIEGILTRAPRANLYVQSVMPRTRTFRARLNQLNARYSALADELGATYVDLWSTLSTSEGEMDPAFSLDRLHLNGAGYRAWTTVLQPLVRSA